MNYEYQYTLKNNLQKTPNSNKLLTNIITATQYHIQLKWLTSIIIVTQECVQLKMLKRCEQL